MSGHKSMSDKDRREDKNDELSPGNKHQVFITMQDLLEKLKLLDYEEHLLAKHNMKPLSRHYFVACPYVVSNSSEQFYMFSVIAAWLITLCGRSFETPQEHNDPNEIVANILTQLRALGGKVDFPPAKLKSGSGEHVCYVLDRLADKALKFKQFVRRSPVYPKEELEAEVVEDEADTIHIKEEEVMEETDEEDEVVLDDLMSKTTLSEVNGPRPKKILESQTNSAQWYLEVENVLPQLTVPKNNKDWRNHEGQMHQHQDCIKSTLKESKGYFDQLLEDISKTQKKMSSREKCISTELEHVIADYRKAEEQLCEVKELCRQHSASVAEENRTIAETTEDLTKIKQDLDKKTSSMSDEGPVVNIRQSFTKLKQEIKEMNMSIEVAEQQLLQAMLKRKNKMTIAMHTTHITATTRHTYL